VRRRLPRSHSEFEEVACCGHINALSDGHAVSAPASASRANEPLPKYAWPGGYPLYYVDGEGNVLCAPCASRDAEPSQTAIDYDINWEDPELTCDDCGAAIECAYPADHAHPSPGERRE
jgi:hypothetical protein